MGGLSHDPSLATGPPGPGAGHAAPAPTEAPLGPPVLFYWGDVAVRTRADIEASGQTWDEFLNSVAGIDDVRQFGMIFEVLKLVPDEECRALRLEIRRRQMDLIERRAAADLDREVEEIMEKPWFKRLMRRAA